MRGHTVTDPFLIISASREDLTNDQNRRRTNTMAELLRDDGIPFKEVKGCYMGAEEDSFLIPMRYSGAAFNLARKFEQETVLEVDAFRTARLIAVDDNSVKMIGVWHRIDKKEKDAQDAWTQDPVTDQYYAVRPAKVYE